MPRPLAGLILVIAFPCVLTLSCNTQRGQGSGADICTQNTLPGQAEQETGINETAGLDRTVSVEPVNYDIGLPEIVDSLGLTPDDLHIKVDKSDYLLSVMSDSTLLKQYPAVFGRNPIDPKLCEGDGCTPEGTFRVLAKYEHQMWSRFIYFDYPNQESMRRFREAIRGGELPHDATPGGQVGIHGVPEGADFAIRERQNWTAGCISLKNKDIEELYDYIMIGSKVIINH